ncbi:MAG: HTH-type transcriptional repressor AseR [Firmicutes bacterium ADurb.Bin182]|nr:MAG: HTH-type transcriptional repressor AseR [Firmicutes bacterium ADurb.Bin182]
MELSDILKALGDSTRLRIFSLLADNELCVCVISEVLKTSQPNVSKHLNRLRYSGIIKCRKISQWCFYGISGLFREKYKPLYDFILSELDRGQQYKEDKKVLDYVLNSDICYQQLLGQKGAKR